MPSLWVWCEAASASLPWVSILPNAFWRETQRPLKVSLRNSPLKPAVAFPVRPVRNTACAFTRCSFLWDFRRIWCLLWVPSSVALLSIGFILSLWPVNYVTDRVSLFELPARKLTVRFTAHLGEVHWSSQGVPVFISTSVAPPPSLLFFYCNSFYII